MEIEPQIPEPQVIIPPEPPTAQAEADAPVQAETDAPVQGEAPKKRKYKARRVTKKTLSKEIERQMLENTPEILKKKWKALGLALDRGEKWAVELVARQFEGDRGPGAVNIVSNTLNVTNEQQQAPGTRSLESVVRMLEAKDGLAKALPQPTEIRRMSPDLPILDAEE